MDESTFTQLGTRHTLAGERPFGLTLSDRLHHLHVIGQTGTGKTTFLKHLAIDDMHRGYGLAFIDPHGDAAVELLDHVPPERMRHVVYLNPSKRSAIPIERRVPFFCYLDEFHSFTTRAFTSILSESRKYKFGLIAAHQYIDQMHADVRAAIFGNVGTTVAFRVGGDDAADLSRHLGLAVQVRADYVSVRPLSLGGVILWLLQALNHHLCA